MAKHNTKRKPAKPPATTEATKQAVFEIGSDAWKEQVKLARARILGGLKANPRLSLERVAELVEQHDEAARKGDTDRCKEIKFDDLMERTSPNGNWHVAKEDGAVYGWDAVAVAVLMDLRRRLDTIIDRLPEKEPRA